MKKVILAVAVIAMVAGFASCKKSVNCKCTYKLAGETIEVPATEYPVKKCDKVELSVAGIEELKCEEVK